MPSIYILPFFKRKLKLAIKKHKSVKTDFLSELNLFLKAKDKHKWKAEYGLYKIRIPLSSENIGKSGGYRTLVLIGQNDIFFPISLYFKGDKEVLSKKEIKNDLIMAKLEIDELFS